MRRSGPPILIQFPIIPHLNLTFVLPGTCFYFHDMDVELEGKGRQGGHPAQQRRAGNCPLVGGIITSPSGALLKAGKLHLTPN